MPPLYKSVKYLLEAGHEVYHLGLQPIRSLLRLPVKEVAFSNSHPIEVNTDLSIRLERAELEKEHIRKIFEEIKPDIVHGFSLQFETLCCVKATIKPFVVSVWGEINDFLTRPDSRPKKRYLPLLESADAVIVQTPDLAKWLAPYLPQGISLHVQHVGIDERLFKPGYEIEQSRWRTILQIPQDAKVIFSPRGWNPSYNHHLILKAYANAVKKLKQPSVLVFLNM